ncbi:MAG: TIGR02996 domain-containing protein [Kofleriaceae bacterium]
MLDQVREEQWADALDALLARYRATPAPELAEAIRAVGKRAIVTVPITFGTSDGARAKKMLARIPTSTGAERGRLLDEIKPIRMALRLDRLEAMLAHHGDDPRISDQLCEILEAIVRAHRLDANPGVLPRVWSMIERCGGIRERIEALPFVPSEVAYTAARDHALSVLVPAPVLPAAEVALYREVTALAATLHAKDDQRARERAGLLAAIYADPAAPAPKAIYADWLQHQADPRGEFIALQLASDSLTSAERALIKLYDKDWRYPFPAGAGYVEYRDGFPVRAAYDTGPIDDDPAWSTVESAAGVPTSDGSHVPLLVELREIRDMHMFMLTRLTKPLAVRTLHWRQSPHVRSTAEAVRIDMFSELDKITVLPALRVLHVLRWVAQRSQVERLMASVIGRQLEHVSVDVAVADFPAALEAIVASPRLESFEIFIGQDSVSAAHWKFTRDPHGKLTHVTGRIVWRHNDPELAQFLVALDAIPAGRITSLELMYGTTTDPVDVERRLRHALQRQTLAQLRLFPYRYE